MQYRSYGRTGLRVSEIGLGGHREGVETRGGIGCLARFFVPARERARVVARALELGVTYFETTYGCEIASLGESLKLLKRRDGLFVSAMRVDFFSNWLAEKGDTRRYVRREVEGRLRDFGHDRVEQFLLGAFEFGDPLAHPRAILEDAFEEFGRLREEGKVRFVGFSSHNPDYAARVLEAFPRFDAVMTPYNFANRVAEGALTQALEKTGAAWIAMKTLVWHVYGIPVTVLRHLRAAPGVEFDPGWPIARLAHQFVLRNPRVATCVPAANAPEAVAENVSASGRVLAAEEERQLEACSRAAFGHDALLLALGGLREENLRVRAHALGLFHNKFKGPKVEINWESDDAEAQARALAQECLRRLREDPGQFLEPKLAELAQVALIQGAQEQEPPRA